VAPDAFDDGEAGTIDEVELVIFPLRGDGTCALETARVVVSTVSDVPRSVSRNRMAAGQPARTRTSIQVSSRTWSVANGRWSARKTRSRAARR